MLAGDCLEDMDGLEDVLIIMSVEEMPLHGLGIASGQDEARTDTALRTDGAEDIGRSRALVLGRHGPGAGRY